MIFTKRAHYSANFQTFDCSGEISSHLYHHTQSAQISQMQDEHNIYAIMKTMCSPGYYHNSFVATHAPLHMMYILTSCAVDHVNHKSCAQVHELPQSHCGDNREGTLLSWLHIYIYIYIYIYITLQLKRVWRSYVSWYHWVVQNLKKNLVFV